MKNNIKKFIQSGEKQDRFLGLEVEHFILDKQNKSVFYSYENEKTGICDILEELSAFYDKKIYEDFKGKKYLIGLSRKTDDISIEPGAQFEISIKAHSDINEIKQIYINFLNQINPILESHKYHLVNIGYRPDACALEVPIIPKMRYINMDANFKNVGTRGFCMMRCSAATQISIDYENEKDCARKMKISTSLCPIFYFLFDNSPIFERSTVGKKGTAPSGIKIAKRMARWYIWNDADTDRCTSSPQIFDKNFNYEAYANIINNLDEVYTPETLENDIDEIKHELSMCFFDVRLKNTIEIRPADSMPPEFTFAYVQLINNLFYNQKALNELWDIFKNVEFQDYVNAGKALYESAWNARIYGHNATDLINKIFSIANYENNTNLNPIKKLISNQKCLKDYLNENYVESNQEFKPISSTKNNTKIQAKCFENCTDEFKNFVEFRKESKVTYMGEISNTGYFSKVFDINNQVQFEKIVRKTHSIIEKVCNEYWSNQDYKKLFKWNTFAEKLINFKPKYKVNVPIARFDIFFNDATGQFEFCEINTGGSAAMSKVTYACEEIKQTLPYKSVKKILNENNKTLNPYDVYSPWVIEFKNIYKEWCTNTKTKFKDSFSVAIVDFLDNCQLPDFAPFQKSFEKHGIRCEICDVRNLIFDGKNLTTKNGIKLDAIYKRVTLDDLENFKEDCGTKAMIDAVFSEVVCPIDWFSSQIAHDKQLFAILHMPQTMNLLNASEKKFIEMHVPQTYILNKNNFNNNEFQNNKNSWIIKPLNSRDSKNVFVGQDLDIKSWKKALQDCSRNNKFVIQKFCKMHKSENVWVNPNEIDKSLNAGVQQFCNMEGLYCYNSKYNGMYLRQGDISKDGTNLDMAIPVFYEDYK